MREGQEMNEAYMSETLRNKYETQATEYDYARLVAAIELLEHKINKEEARLAEYTDNVRPVPIIDVDSLKEVLVVAGRKQKEIEVI